MRPRLLSMVALLLVNAPLAAQEPFPSSPPVAVRLRPVQFPPFREVALPNGMTLVLVENHEQPTLSLSLSFRAGTYYDPPGKEGLSAMVAELLTKGTPTRDAEQLAAEIEGVGGTISASSGDEHKWRHPSASDRNPPTVPGSPTRRTLRPTIPPSAGPRRRERDSGRCWVQFPP